MRSINLRKKPKARPLSLKVQPHAFTVPAGDSLRREELPRGPSGPRSRAPQPPPGPSSLPPAPACAPLQRTRLARRVPRARWPDDGALPCVSVTPRGASCASRPAPRGMSSDTTLLLSGTTAPRPARNALRLSQRTGSDQVLRCARGAQLDSEQRATLHRCTCAARSDDEHLKSHVTINVL